MEWEKKKEQVRGLGERKDLWSLFPHHRLSSLTISLSSPPIQCSLSSFTFIILSLLSLPLESLYLTYCTYPGIFFSSTVYVPSSSSSKSRRWCFFSQGFLFSPQTFFLRLPSHPDSLRSFSLRCWWYHFLCASHSFSLSSFYVYLDYYCIACRGIRGSRNETLSKIRTRLEGEKLLLSFREPSSNDGGVYECRGKFQVSVSLAANVDVSFYRKCCVISKMLLLFIWLYSFNFAMPFCIFLLWLQLSPIEKCNWHLKWSTNSFFSSFVCHFLSSSLRLSSSLFSLLFLFKGVKTIPPQVYQVSAGDWREQSGWEM